MNIDTINKEIDILMDEIVAEVAFTSNKQLKNKKSYQYRNIMLLAKKLKLLRELRALELTEP